MNYVEQHLKHPVARGAGDRSVKDNVMLNKRVLIVGALRHGSDRPVQCGEVGGGSPFGGSSSKFRLHHEASFEQFVVRNSIQQQ